MKISILFLGLLSTAKLFGQTSILSTNNVVFDRLMSYTNTILMTNAEFRCAVGDRLFFKNNAGYQGFHIYDLHSNILTCLHLTEDQLNLQQVKLESQNSKNLNSFTIESQQNAPKSGNEHDDQDFDNRVKKELEESDDIMNTADSIIDGINTAFSELIERAELSDAYQWRINQVVDKFENERDKEKMKVLGMAREIAWHRLQDEKLAEQIAKQNLSNTESKLNALLQTNLTQ